MNRRMLVGSLLLALAVEASPASAAEPAAPNSELRLARGVEQLRHVVGKWHATTEFLKPDGSIARAVKGTYDFAWVVPDRVLSGRSEIPEMGQVSGILFYVRPGAGIIEMVSVGAEGQLWVMSGPVDGEVRTTPDVAMPDGSKLRLRFTRSDVAADRFESRMEYSADGGASWAPGNHQVFTRAAPAAEGAR